jgi:hypothetical protein
MTAPGGKTTICLGLCDDVEATEPQAAPDVRPVGGAATICLGLLPDETSSPDHAKQSNTARHIGGPTTICLGLLEEQGKEPQKLNERVAPGGATTICLGLPDPKKAPQVPGTEQRRQWRLSGA